MNNVNSTWTSINLLLAQLHDVKTMIRLREMIDMDYECHKALIKKTRGQQGFEDLLLKFCAYNQEQLITMRDTMERELDFRLEGQYIAK